MVSPRNAERTCASLGLFIHNIKRRASKQLKHRRTPNNSAEFWPRLVLVPHGCRRVFATGSARTFREAGVGRRAGRKWRQGVAGFWRPLSARTKALLSAPRLRRRLRIRAREVARHPEGSPAQTCHHEAIPCTNTAMTYRQPTRSSPWLPSPESGKSRRFLRHRGVEGRVVNNLNPNGVAIFRPRSNRILAGVGRFPGSSALG